MKVAERVRQEGDDVGRAPGGKTTPWTLVQATPELVSDYFRLFVNRPTLQSTRPHPESGRHYYYRPKAKGTEKPLSLTIDIIRRHLEGELLTLGLYAINPTTQRCKWLAIDADYKGAMEDLVKLQYHLSEDKVQAALEMSKRGGISGFS